MTDALQRMESCARAYMMHAKGVGIREIRRRVGVKTDASARLMVARGALLKGRVAKAFGNRTRVCHLPLPTKVAKALFALEIRTVGQARATSDEVYLQYPGFGPHALRTLRAVLDPAS